MPYVEQFKRGSLHKVVELMLELGVMPNGDLNYILYKYCQEWIKYKAVKGESYNNYKAYLGELDCAKQEIYRRQVAEYEDRKKEENGDV